MTQPSASVAAAVAALNAKLYERGLNTSRDGNVSARAGGLVYMTPTKYRGPTGNEGITAARIVAWPETEAPPDATLVSSEWRHHVRAYRASAEIGAVIHCHAPHATALASRDDRDALLERLGRFSEYELYDALPIVTAGAGILPEDEATLASAHTVLCPFHGVTALGRDLTHAFERLERLEFYARIVLLTTR